ncbi:MAG: hypothetical protein Fur002_16520 [Anaerolineales bacterium]
MKPSIRFLSIFLSLLTVFALLPAQAAHAATVYQSAATGDWNVATNWSPNGVPGATDVVTILNGHTMNMTAGVSVDSLTIDAGGRLETNAFNLTVETALTNNGTLIAGANIITLNGSFVNAGTFDAANGQVVYGGAGAQTIANVSYYDLTIGGSGVKTSSGASILTVGNNLTIDSGAAMDVAHSIEVGGVTDISGAVTHSGANPSQFTGGFTVNASGTWDNTGNAAVTLKNGLTNNGTFNAGTGVYSFKTNVSQSFNGNAAISTLSVDNLITLANNGNLNITTALSGSGALTQTAGSTLTLGGTVTLNTLTATANPNTVIYNKAGAQTAKNTSYYNLELSGSGAKTLTGITTISGNLTLSGTATATTATDLTIGGDLIINSGAAFTIRRPDTLTLNGNAVISGTLTNGDGSGSVQDTKTYNGNVTINSGGQWKEAYNPVVNIAGNIVNDGAFSVTTTGLHTFSGTGKTLSGANEIKIPNVEVSGSYTNNGNLNVSAALTGSGTLTQGAGGVLSLGGTITSGVLNAAASGNTVRYNGGAAQTVDPSIAYQILAIAGSGVKTLTGVTVNELLSMESAATVNTAPTYAANAGLQYNNSAAKTTGVEWVTPFTPSGGVTLLGAGVVTLGRSSVANAIVIASGATLQTNSNLTNKYSLAVTSDLINNGTLTTQNATITVNGVLYNNNFLNVNNAATLQLNHLNNAGSITSTNTDAPATFILSGDFTNTGIFTGIPNFNLTLEGGNDQQIAGFNSNVSAFTVNKSGGVATLTGDVGKTAGGWVMGSLVMQNGVLNLGSGLTHNFRNLTLSGGTLQAGSSDVYINGAASIASGTLDAQTSNFHFWYGVQTIPAASYYNLTTTGGNKPTGGAITVQHNLTVEGGTLSVGGYNFTVNGTTVIASGATLTNNNTAGNKTFGDVENNGIWRETVAEDIVFTGSFTNNNVITAHPTNSLNVNANTGVHTFTGASKTIGGSRDVMIPKATVNGTYTNEGTLKISTALAGSGTLTQGASGILYLTSGVTIINLNASVAGNLVNYNGSAAQTIKDAVYHHLTLSGTGAKTIASPATINGNLTVSANTAANADLTIGGNLLVNSKTTLTIGGVNITVNGTTTADAGVITHSASAGVKRYKGTVSILKVGGKWTNSGNADIYLENGLTFSGDGFTSGTGVYTFETNLAQTIGGTNSFSIANIVLPSGVTLINQLGTGDADNAAALTVSSTLSGGGTFQQGDYAIFNFGGTALADTITLNAYATGNTVTYNRTSGAQTVKAVEYYNLTLDKGGAKDISAVTTIGGGLKLLGAGTTGLTGASLDIGSLSATMPNVYDLHIGSGSTLTVANTTLTVNGPTLVSGTLIHNNSLGVKTYKELVLVNGAWNNSSNSDIHLQGGLTTGVSSGFIAGATAAYIFETTPEQALTLNKAGTFGTINVGSGVTLTNVGAGLTVNNVISGAGTLKQGVNSSLTLPLSVSISVAGLDLTTNPNTVTYNYAGNQTIAPFNYYNLTLTGSGNKDISGISAILGDLKIGGAAIVTLTQDLTIGGSIGLFASSATGKLDISTYNLYVGKNWQKTGGTFASAATGAVIFNGSVKQTIVGGAGYTPTTFNNLIINQTGSEGVSIGTGPIINGSLTLTKGIVTLNASNLYLTLGKDATISGGDADSYVIGNVKKIFKRGLQNYTFPLGDATGYRPLTLTNFNVTGPATDSGFITANVSAAEHAKISTAGISSAKKVAGYWKLTAGGSIAYTGAFSVTMDFLNPEHLLGGANPSNFAVRRYQNSSPIAWNIHPTGASSATSITATGITALGTSSDFVVGELPTPVFSPLSAVNGAYGNSVTLSATLKNSSNAALGGRTVRFQLNGADVGSAVTNASGVATLNNVLLDLDVAAYPSGFSAFFDGDLEYSSASANADLTVTQRNITVTAVTDNKQYDGTTQSALLPVISGGLVGDDTPNFTQTYNDATVNVGKTLTPSGAIDGGATGGVNGTSNYNITFMPIANGVITQKQLTIDGVSANNKVYDGGTDATITNLSAAIHGIVGSEDVQLGVISGQFTDKNVGAAKGVIVVFTLTGADAGNYTYNPSASLAADITPLPITIQALTDTKFYDGSNASAVTPNVTVGALVGADTVIQTFDSPDAATGKTLTPVIQDGNNGNNYAANLLTATGDINKATLTITADEIYAYRASPLPTFTYAVTGFASGEGFTAAPSCSSPTADMKIIGNYPILCSGGTASANYATPFTYVDGVFHVTQSFSATLRSTPMYDGYVLGNALTNAGGLFNSSLRGFYVGDNRYNQTYRGMLDFDTSSLPSTAVITTAYIQLKQMSSLGKNPLSAFGKLVVNLNTPAFGADRALASDDFGANPSFASIAGTFNAPVASWHTANLVSSARAAIDRDGVTQFRVRFTGGTNFNRRDEYILFASGNSPLADRPILYVEYYIP